MTNKRYGRWSVTAQSAWKKSTATLTGTSRIRLPPASPPYHDRTATKVSQPCSINWRLTAHPPVTPGRVLLREAQNQITDLAADRWPTGRLPWIGPFPGEEVTPATATRWPE